VDDVKVYYTKVLEHGGSALGEMAEKKIEGVGTLTVAYMRDPEGNIVEILNWK
jgi:predicted enzyme related to lactoylglutathione lyase